MAWTWLILAGLCEVAWPIALKYSQGFSKLLPSVGTLAAMAASAGLLGLALRSLPVGTGYAAWTGIGIIGTTALGIYLFGDSAAWPRLACIGLIVCGVIGLKVTS